MYLFSTLSPHALNRFRTPISPFRGFVQNTHLSKIGKWFRKIESEWKSQIPNNEKQMVLEEK
ncbi:hypothetical protein CON94_26340 [Bacillus pseudomycoides]|nr:hypothetical protein CON94_26340 [Bacillus pseudomycoides]PEL79209.1 hypothetical protein CN615_25970 [Bacillus pseudomycoides]